MAVALKRARAGDRQVDVATFNALCDAADMVFGLRDGFSPDFGVSFSGKSLKVWLTNQGSGSSGTFDASLFQFGFETDGATVTIKSGYVLRGMRTPILVAQTDVTITADHQWVPLEISLNADTAAIGTPTTSVPQSDATTFRVGLHKFRLQGAAGASIEQYGWLGPFPMPGTGA